MVTGEALSLATAGVQAVLTVSVRDNFHNWQPDPSVAQASISVAMLDTVSGAWMMGRRRRGRWWCGA